jgi:hypothetical protein
VKIMRNMGKRICTNKEYIAAINILPCWDILDESNSSTKVKDFFDLLWVTQLGVRSSSGNWDDSGRGLWSVSEGWDINYDIGCLGIKGKLSKINGKSALGLWFIEN